jgi:hypothetical protein
MVGGGGGGDLEDCLLQLVACLGCRDDALHVPARLSAGGGGRKEAGTEFVRRLFSSAFAVLLRIMATATTRPSFLLFCCPLSGLLLRRFPATQPPSAFKRHRCSSLAPCCGQLTCFRPPPPRRGCASLSCPASPAHTATQSDKANNSHPHPPPLLALFNKTTALSPAWPLFLSCPCPSDHVVGMGSDARRV